MRKVETLKRKCFYDKCINIVYYKSWQDKIGRGRFCSRRCLALDTASRRDSLIKTHCFICKKDMVIWPYQKNIDDKYYCSRNCGAKSDKSLLNIRRVGGNNFGKIGYFKNKKRPEMSGENNVRWIKDRSLIKIGDRSLNDPLQKGWRKAVKDRDGWKCRIADENCFGTLEAHHILPWSEFPELRYNLNNGITLCHAHHPRKKEDVVKLSPYFQQLVASLD